MNDSDKIAHLEDLKKKRKEALEYYLSLPSKERSVKRVAEHFDVALSTVTSWSTSDKWTKLVDQKKRDILNKQEKDKLDDILKFRELVQDFFKMVKHEKLMNKKQAKIAKKNKQPLAVKPYSFLKKVGDLKEVMLLIQLLSNQPTSRSEVITREEEERQVEDFIRANPDAKELLKKMIRNR